MAADDDLNTPLGQETPRKSKLPKLPFGAPQLLAGLFGLFGLVAVGWAVFGNDPLGGEPMAVVATAPATQGQEAVDALGGDGPAGSAPIPRMAAAKPAAHPVVPPGAKTVTIIDGSSGKRQDVVVPGSEAPKAASRSPEVFTPRPSATARWACVRTSG